MGLPSIRSPGVALNRSPSSGLRPRVDTISPPSRNASDTNTAWFSNPPGLLRMSSTTPFTLSIPPASSIWAARPSVRFGNVWSLNVVIRSTTVSPSVRARTAVSLMLSRMIDKSKGCSSPSRTTVITISDPTGPRIRSTASCKVSPSTLSPFTAVMKSPDWIPAASAGVPSIGDTTLIQPSSCVTSRPRPPNSPSSCRRIAAASSGDI